jgi:hypothetical protein
VPHTRIGKHVRFTNDHLRRVIDAGEVHARSGEVDGSPEFEDELTRLLGLAAAAAVDRPGG